MYNGNLKLQESMDPRRRWKWRLPPVKLVNNQDFYCNLVEGKTVLHIGCTDHKELIDIKIREHQYLHIKLMKHAKIVYGIDINKEAIDYLKYRYNITNIYYCDITQTTVPSDMLESYDIVLIPEVIEHIPDLGGFLKGIKKFMSLESLLVIGSPNSFRVHNLLTVFKGYEEINPDHRYYFSYSTLKHLLEESGFIVDKWYIYIYANPNRKLLKYGVRSLQSLLKSIFIEISPWFGDGIIVQAKLRTP